MPVHNLPAFKPEGARFPRPDRPREWVEQQGSLKVLGQSLLVDEDPFADPDEPIRAIPDPWAQARTFAEALHDPEHSMHRAFMAQWRGLLALLALRWLPGAGYTIDYRTLELGERQAFDRVLSRLHPQIAIGGDIQLWKQPVIVSSSDGRRSRPIAMLNPACLVSPGRMSQSLHVPNVAWAQRGIVDPLALKGDLRLPAASLVILRKYLENLRAQLGELRHSEAGDLIRERLQEYIGEIDDELGVSVLAAEVGGGADPRLPPLYRALFATVKLQPVENPASTSECRLVLKEKAGHGSVKGIILVDESLGQSTGRSARDTFVWGVRTLSELLSSRPAFDIVKREAAEQGYLVVTAEDLFTPRAVALRLNPRIPGHSQATKSMLLPVRPITLLLDGHLPNLVDVDTDQSRATVMLKVKLDRPGQAVTHTIVRHYRDEPEAGGGLFVPDAAWVFFNAAVWPNFRTPSWKSYFARLFHQKTGNHIRPRCALSASIIDSALAEAPDQQQAVQLLSQINQGALPARERDWFRVSEVDTEVAHDEVQVSDRGFEAIFYTDGDEDRGDAPVGCVYLDIRPVQTRPSQTAQVAVDFGTTNTVACSEDMKPIQLQERLVNPISYDDSATVHRQRWTFRWQFIDFFPPEMRGLPTPTVAIRRDGAPEDSIVSVCRNVIYFHPLGSVAEGDTANELGRYAHNFGRCVFNLKWSDDHAHVTAASDFLSQLMMLIAAEKADQGIDPASIKWRFSLPDGMTGRTRRNFEQQLARLTAPHGNLDGLHSEGLAAAKYMLAGNSGSGFNPGSINAVLDIGGGTTDITLWLREEPLWRGSFRLAGQSFFTRTFVQNPRILRDIGLGEWADLLDPRTATQLAQEATKLGGKLSGVNPADLPHLAELLFSGPALARAMDENWALKLNLQAGETLRIAGLVFIGGLAYYLGLVARSLVEQGLLDESKLKDPAFALCGRGGGLFNRIHGKLPPNGNSDVTAALKLFSHAAQSPGLPRPRLFLEPDSKLEVVRGMVTDYALIDSHVDARREASSTHLPSGVGLSLSSGTIVSPHQSVHAAMEAARADRIDLAVVEDFLNRFEAEVDTQVDLRADDPEGAHSMIANEVRASVDRARDEDGKLHLGEPPFVTALRELIGNITLAPEDPRRRVVVRVAQ
jgi:hypothetical protein